MCARAWDKWEKDTSIFGPAPGVTEQLVSITADGTIDEDLYCLTCGYNVRGLAGDPVRCPECGELNDIGTLTAPADRIRVALRKMETAPTFCVASAVLFAFPLPYVFSARGADVFTPIFFCLLLGGSWLIARARMKTTFEDKPGWGRILLDFHLVALLCTLFVPLLVLRIKAAGRYPELNGWEALGLSIVAAVPPFLLGLRFYRSSRARLSTMQRHVAVKIARQALARKLRSH